jgi:tRNA pseudouridine55 synthase
VDGVLVVDKPEGLTSHDVVAVARRALGESRIGHTGTLDPLATGVLPLACGRATRLVRFLMASDKDYDATIRFGVTTDSYDSTGAETSRSDRQPTREAVLAALRSLTGDHLQMPPAFSAKNIAGHRAYDIARRRPGEAIALTPVPVTVSRAELTAFDGISARVGLTCSAGFYVRTLAHELGARVGTGACLDALRRTRSGEFDLASAVTVADLQGGRDAVAARFLPLERLLPGFPAASLTAEGITWVSHGRVLGAAQIASWPATTGEWVRLLTPDGRLIALARPVPGLAPSGVEGPDSLHPAVVLL